MIDQASFEEISLALDNGTKMTFRGRQFAGESWFDEERNVLTHQNLYVTDTNEQVFSIVTGEGNMRSRRAYRVFFPQDNVCVIHDGRSEITLSFDMLKLAVRSLTGLEDGLTLDMIEETLKAARCGTGTFGL